MAAEAAVGAAVGAGGYYKGQKEASWKNRNGGKR